MGKTVFIKDTAITGKDRTRDFYGVFLGILREKGLVRTRAPLGTFVVSELPPENDRGSR